MVLRVFGLKEETNYGEDIPTEGITPDWHKKVSKGSFKLNDEAITFGDGSRMNQFARPGGAKPTGSIEGKVDLKRIGHTLKAFLDQYAFTPAEEGGANVHEFWGSESSDLHSFQGVCTFDEFEKRIKGLLLDSLKLEVSDEAMTMSEEWVYQNQEIQKIDQATYDVREVEGAIPIMFYDVLVELDGNTPPGVCSNFTFEGKNNINQDNVSGLGSRFPQAKPQAQKRELTQSIVSTLRSSTLDFIKKAEHGDNTDTPSNCLVSKLSIKLIISICENTNERLEMFFPDCLVNVEYEASESDEIETTFNLSSLGSGEATKNDGTKVTTDMYCKLITDVGEITPSTE
ncbi:MAG: phage tail tube protein [Methanobrevibacter sp.]|uniref:phage tail tube protein n=1 Tax=Methanobrevibacter sp. TaxID=66852 RepID=UPI003F0A991E